MNTQPLTIIQNIKKFGKSNLLNPIDLLRYVIILYYPITFIIKGGAAIATFTLAVVAYKYSRKKIQNNVEFSDKDKSRHRLVFLSFIIFTIAGVALDMSHGEPISSIGKYIPFFLTPFVANWISKNDMQSLYFWISAAAGGILAFCLAANQNIFHQNMRANGLFNNPIFFGNFSLLLGIASLLALVFFQEKWGRNALCLFIFGALSGIFGSFFSGSKGGWISLPLTLIYIGNIAYKRWPKKYFFTGFFALMLAIASAFFLPNSPVASRISNLTGDLKAGDAGSGPSASNLGTARSRIEMWKFGLNVLDENPIFGFGIKELQNRKKIAVESGEANPIIVDYTHVHNEILDIYLENGAIGLMSWLLLFTSIFRFFLKFRLNPDPEVQALSTMGMTTILLFVEFGLTNPLFPFNTPRNFFCGTIAILIGITLAVAKASKANRNQNENLLRSN